MGRGVYRSYYKGHKDKRGREVGLAGVGWRDGEKMQTIVTEFKKKTKNLMRYMGMSGRGQFS